MVRMTTQDVLIQASVELNILKQILANSETPVNTIHYHAARAEGSGNSARVARAFAHLLEEGIVDLEHVPVKGIKGRKLMHVARLG